MTATLSIGITGSKEQQAGFDVASGLNVLLELPKNFPADHHAVALRDFEILKDILKGHPREFEQIAKAAAEGKFADAKKVAEKIGLTEENFIRLKGGCWVAVAVICVVAIVGMAHD